MGRPEKPVDHTVPALGALAEHLRAMRRDACLTYRQLAERTHYSTAQLKRAASGVSLPSYGLVLSYARGCNNYLERAGTAQWRARMQATNLYEEAREAVHRNRIEARASTVRPKPEYVRDIADLSGALRDAWARAGRLPSRKMEARSGGQLPHSTAHAICKGRSVPRDFRQFATFLHACEISGTALGPWFRARFKICGRPSEKAVAAALQFLWQTDERRIFLDLYAEGAETPEQSREELGLVAEIIQQLSDCEAAVGAPSVRSDKRVDTATLHLSTGAGKTMSLLALLDGAARGSLPGLEPSRKPLDRAATRRVTHDYGEHSRRRIVVDRTLVG
ncbi:helix-turn-helix domain-containing protein [Streptomyces sp. NPDC044780]|uniref:helix-turn-helix domain-containing protein n=1 Tax=unclassified Streptomyces TaxID=2593676 RepID=UPI0033D88F1F